jgi:sulfide:quinone oxidoreductase
MDRTTEKPRVVVLGGGIAGVEAVLALHDLAGELGRVTLVSDHRDLLFKPLAIEEPFSGQPAPKHDLPALMADLGGDFVGDRVAGVRPAEHLVELADGSELAYDALLVCVGARAEPALEGATTLDPTRALEIEPLIATAADSPSARLAVVIPSGAAWPLPAYELALLTRRRIAERAGSAPEVELVTPEERPLGFFGAKAADAVAELLRGRQVAFRGSTRLEQRADGSLTCRPGGDPYEAGAIIALPVLRGAELPGLPADDDGFIPIDSHARVEGIEDVWAAGDGTSFPVKQGGLAAEQADAAAEDIARRLGAAVHPEPFSPVLRGQLLTGEDSLHMRAELEGGHGEGDVSADLLWWPPSKVVGRYLPSFLAYRGADQGATPPRTPLDVEVGLHEQWHGDPMLPAARRHDAPESPQ